MSNTKNDGRQGDKTHARQQEILQSDGKHDDAKIPDAEVAGAETGARVRPMTEGEKKTNLDGKDGRQSEFPVSRGGMNQESRQHNKH